MIREIVTIDEDLCDGCGLCIPSCHEGALKIIDGKARLVADNLCDGLGDCLGHCPQGAIKVERREADEFDEGAVSANVAKPTEMAPPKPCACPGTNFAQFAADTATPCAASPSETRSSQLTHWPVQLHLLPPDAPVLRGAKLLITATCVPVAYADFQTHLLREHAVVVACPKLDNTAGYLEKLETMIRDNDLQEITVARMEVPCCGGILDLALEAHRRAESTTPLNEIVVGTRGEAPARRRIA